MNNKVIEILSFSFLFLIIVYQILVIRNVSNSSNAKDNEILKQAHNISTLKSMLNDEWLNEGIKLNNTVIRDENGNDINIDRIAVNKPILIFRFSKIDCSKCVIEQIDLIKELIQNKEIDYIMICDYRNQRDLGLFKRINAINSVVYDSEKLLEGEERTPYFFIYYKGIVCDVFFPDDDFKDLTINYLNSIAHKYFVSHHQ